MSNPIVLISGVPATGKSSFGSWLQDNRGFVHVDIESEARGFKPLGLLELDALWQGIAHLPPPPVDPFVDALRGLEAPVVLDWGFDPRFLPLVERLHVAGISAWWFDGDRAAARRRFIARNTVSVDALDIQMPKIVAAWNAMIDFYGDRIIRTLRADGSFVDWDMVAEDMFPDQ